jgi:ParB family chromosome partitioning protein
MVRKTGLGRGLDALIPGDETPAHVDGVTSVSVQCIQPNPRQPRSTFKPEELEDLANSIKEHGILQPLIVSSAPVDGTYILIAGERRLKAAIQAGLDTVPVIIRQVSDEQQLELALIENIQRADLNALETAEAYRHLTEDFHLSHEEIAAKVGKNRATVTNTLRLLKLPDAGRKALLDGSITEGHARAVLALSTPQAQLSALQVIIKQNLNVRQTELLVQRLNGHRTSNPRKDQPDPKIQSIEERLRSSLGTKVNLHHGKKGGSIVIHYYSDEELGAILDRLTDE